MAWRWKILIVAAVFALTGCLGSSSGPTGMPGKTFGVFNAFPDHPLYLKKKTLVAGHRSGGIQTISLKPELTAAVIRFLEAKGYRAVAVNDPSALKAGEVDMLIQILPRKVHKMEGMVAYGFSDREFLWGLVKRPASSFVAMQMTLQRGNSPRIYKAAPEERFSGLETGMMPETWEALSRKEQEAFEENLRENMVKAAYISLSRLKI